MAKEKYYMNNPSSCLPTGTTGAIHEFKVAIDLMEKGYEVFRALSPACSCDLAILKNGKLLKIEVKTTYRLRSGKIVYPKIKNPKYDILVLVIRPNEIIYLPEVEAKLASI